MAAPVDDAHLLALAARITQSVLTVLDEYAKAGRPVPSLDSTDSSATLVTAPIREAVRVIEGACAQLCASVAPPEQVIAGSRAGRRGCILSGERAGGSARIRLPDPERPMTDIKAVLFDAGNTLIWLVRTHEVAWHLA